MLRNEKSGRLGPLSHRRTTAGMQEIEQRMEQLPGSIMLSPTGT
jgi:hypothetical protein